MRWRAASPAFRVPAQWPSSVAGARGVVGAGVGVCAAARFDERSEISTARKTAIREIPEGRFLMVEIVRT